VGLRIDPNRIVITGADNEVKFTTERRMPHIIGNTTGEIGHTVIMNEEGNAALSDTNILIATNPALATGEVFSLNFIKIAGSNGDTGGKYITANGSLTATIYNNGNGNFQGSTLITTGPPGNGEAGVFLQIRTAVNGWDGTLSGGAQLSFTIYYRVFYGRFQ